MRRDRLDRGESCCAPPCRRTPITLGALAGICCERTGVVNIGIEGMMLTAAFCGFMAALFAHQALANAVLSLAVGVAGGDRSAAG